MWEYRAALVRALDADTLRILADTGFGGRQEEDIRLLDVSAPEKTQPGGPESLTYVTAWLGALPAARWPLLVRTVPSTVAEPTERRSFVRYLGIVFPVADRTRCLNTDLAGFLTAHPEWGTGL